MTTVLVMAMLGYCQAGSLLNRSPTELLSSTPTSYYVKIGTIIENIAIEKRDYCKTWGSLLDNSFRLERKRAIVTLKKCPNYCRHTVEARIKEAYKMFRGFKFPLIRRRALRDMPETNITAFTSSECRDIKEGVGQWSFWASLLTVLGQNVAQYYDDDSAYNNVWRNTRCIAQVMKCELLNEITNKAVEFNTGTTDALRRAFEMLNITHQGVSMILILD